MSFGSSKSESKPVDMTPQAFKNLQQPYANTLQGLLNQFDSSGSGSKLINGYQGPTVAGMTGNEGNTLNQLQAAANNISNTSNPNSLSGVVNAGNSTGAQANTANQLMANNQNPTSSQSAASYLASLNGASNGVYNTNADANPYLQAAIQAAQRPTQQALEETLSRTLPGRFTQAGQIVQPNGSSAFDRAAAIATRGTADALGDIASNISYSNYNDAANRAASALGQYTTGQQNANLQSQQIEAAQQQNAASNSINAANTQSNINSQEINSLMQNLQAQALPRLINDLGIERGMEAFNNNTNALLAGLGLSGSTTQPTVANSSSSSSTQVGLGGAKLK